MSTRKHKFTACGHRGFGAQCNRCKQANECTERSKLLSGGKLPSNLVVRTTMSKDGVAREFWRTTVGGREFLAPVQGTSTADIKAAAEILQNNIQQYAKHLRVVPGLENKTT